MKVIFDVTVIGEGRRWSATGICRVVDNLARALNNSGKCSLNFSVSRLEWLYYTLKHIEEASDLKAITFPHSAWRYQAYSKYLIADQRADAASGFSKICWVLARKILHRSAVTFHPQIIPETSLNRADVFHSPFYAIPSQARGRKNLSIFITVHDIIAILYPQYSDRIAPGQPPYLKAIIDGIQNEDWVVCVSQKTKEDLCNYRKDIDPRRVFVTHLGASNWFYPCNDTVIIEKVRLKYKIPEGRYILSLCTFEPRKNLAHLIRCFTQLVQQEPLTDLRLVLAGSLGWKYESIFAELTSADSAIRERIIVVGRVADEDMAALYSGATAFVYPSLYEGFGLPPLEAMQCGTPVITSNTSSLPEVIGNAGIMVDPQDTDGLCQAMLQLATKPDLRQAMSQKSLEQAGRFSWARCADQTLAAYATAVNSRN